MRVAAALALALVLVACRKNPYESAPSDAIAQWKRVPIPLASGTQFLVSEGAFGKSSHNQPGIQYRWDFDVPYGTSVLSIDDGTVLAVVEPHQGGGCDAKYSEVPNSIMVKAVNDGTVAQYVHIDSRVTVGQAVHRGDTIAVTAMNGYICRPQLDFLVYRSDQTLYDSPQRASLPLRFIGLPRELAAEGVRGVAP